MTKFTKMVAMLESTVVLAKDGIGVRIEHANKFPALEQYLVCDCKSSIYNGYYVVKGSEEYLYRVIRTMANEYLPSFIVC